MTEPMTADDPVRERARAAHFVQSLERGLNVIRAFDATTPQMTLSEVAHATGLTRAAARRFLLTLVDLGYVRSDGRRFSLTPGVLRLGYSYLSALSLPEVAEPHLERLVASVHESSSVSVLDGDDIVYVARIPTSRIMTVAISVGTRFPAYATSMGRVLLADLPGPELDERLDRAANGPITTRTTTDPEALRREIDRARRQGWSLVDQELEDGLRSIAAPIRDAAGTVVAAANISAASSRTPAARMRRELLPLLLDATAGIEADLRAARR
ncbi:IclR family transcriptional regulator C-terminal domain-containing protein [Actinomadura meridiana]|uniref:IclR family transcriptional regulator C-terminal domain-containing protein n=1 Tax=Actinomadura meridiana TaxID=559626 RepID=A0ABP8C1C4_9ACTN